MATYDMPTTETTVNVSTKKKRGRKSKAEKLTEQMQQQMFFENRSEETESTSYEPTTSEPVAETPKKRGGRRKKDDSAPAAPKGARKGWSNEQPENNPTDGRISSVKEFMYIEIELLREALGMMPSNPDLLDNYISTKAPDKATREEEVAELSEQEVVDKMSTIWPFGYFYVDEKHEGVLVDKADPFTDPAIKSITNDADCIVKAPYLYDYQIRGMFKDSCGMLWRAKGQNLSSGLKAYKKIIDGGIYVFPRHIGIEMPDTYIDDDGNIKQTFDEHGRLFKKQRSMRTSSPAGQFNALASSEVVPAGSRMRFVVGLTDPDFRKYVEEWLDYGLVRGIAQWRNSGTGIFRWRECNSDWTPIE